MHGWRSERRLRRRVRYPAVRENCWALPGTVRRCASLRRDERGGHAPLSARVSAGGFPKRLVSSLQGGSALTQEIAAAPSQYRVHGLPCHDPLRRRRRVRATRAHACAGCYACAGSDADEHADADSYANGDTYAAAGCYSCSDAHTAADCYSCAHPDGNGDADSYTNGDSSSHRNTVATDNPVSRHRDRHSGH